MELRNKIKKITVFTALLILAISPVSAIKKLNILTTNSWTTAYALAAGVDSPGQLAPSNMVHPPEYELKTSDVKKIKNADLMIFAGYEILMKTINEKFKKNDDQMLKIETGYDPVKMKNAIMSIAERNGTEDYAVKSIREIDDFFSTAVTSLKTKGIYGSPVFVNFHQKPLAEALGFKIIGVFGPMPLKVRQLQEFGNLKPVLIIDNVHNPLGQPLGEITGAERIELVNFPGYTGKDGKKVPATLIGVLKYNLKTLLDLKI
ncbi:MAG: hypothetical protein JW982_03790 [Spirochaetes bacterium]|nr:hypothetical protein [Spirochaetota bacterium]